MPEDLKQENKTSITLKGSAQLVSDFFYYGLNSILYQRGIYPSESFNYTQQYGLTLFTITDKEVINYLDNVLKQVKVWLEAGKVERLVLVVLCVLTGEVLERWDFQIENEEGFEPGAEGREKKTKDKDLKTIQREMRDVIRQITACVTFLPLLDKICRFDLKVYTKKDAEVPEKWDDSAACLIPNGETVKLKSFSTSVHKVNACVSYKMD